MRVVAVMEELHILVSPLNSAFVDVPVPTKPLHAIDGGICTPADRAERERIEDNGRVAYALLTISSPLAVRDCLLLTLGAYAPFSERRAIAEGEDSSLMRATSWLFVGKRRDGYANYSS